MRYKKSNFTLIELFASIAIISILIDLMNNGLAKAKKKGFIDEIEIFDRALKEREIAGAYEIGLE